MKAMPLAMSIANWIAVAVSTTSLQDIKWWFSGGGYYDDTKDHDDICLPSALMQDCVKTSHWHILRDHHLGWIGILPYWESFFIIDSSSLSPIITIIIATHQIWRWVTASKDWQHVRMRKDSELKLKLYHQIQIPPKSWGYEVVFFQVKSTEGGFLPWDILRWSLLRSLGCILGGPEFLLLFRSPVKGNIISLTKMLKILKA